MKASGEILAVSRRLMSRPETRALLTELLAIKFDPKVVKEAARVAARKGITRAGLIRMYVQEGLARDRE